MAAEDMGPLDGPGHDQAGGGGPAADSGAGDDLPELHPYRPYVPEATRAPGPPPRVAQADTQQPPGYPAPVHHVSGQHVSGYLVPAHHAPVPALGVGRPAGQPPKAETSVLAISALIISLACFPLLGGLLGVVALVRTGHTKRAGRGPAIAAIVIGFGLPLVGMVVWAALLTGAEPASTP